MAPNLSPKIVNIDGGLKEVRYASGQNKSSFFHCINNGIYEMEKREGRGLDPDDDSGKIDVLDDNEDDTEKEVANEVIVVKKTTLMDTNWNPFNGICANTLSLVI